MKIPRVVKATILCVYVVNFLYRTIPSQIKDLQVSPDLYTNMITAYMLEVGADYAELLIWPEWCEGILVGLVTTFESHNLKGRRKDASQPKRKEGVCFTALNEDLEDVFKVTSSKTENRKNAF
ncbi:hypothetical protein J6590_092650 [Homalodisca vitripennis]|nr:hypothetical protein J6590_092650 [Homalodisca vitripennis]